MSPDLERLAQAVVDLLDLVQRDSRNQNLRIQNLEEVVKWLSVKELER